MVFATLQPQKYGHLHKDKMAFNIKATHTVNKDDSQGLQRRQGRRKGSWEKAMMRTDGTRSHHRDLALLLWRHYDSEISKR